MPDSITPRIPLRLRTDCEAMEAKQRRSHYSAGCRSTLCTAEIAAYQREHAAQKRTSGGANGSASTRSSESRPGETEAPIRTPEPAAVTRTEPVPPETSNPKPAPPLGNPVAAVGATRRLRGLVAFGYTPKQLAEHTRLPVDAVWWMLIDPPASIQAINHAAIITAFKQLRDQHRTPNLTTVDGRAAARAYHLAEEHDWAGAYDWEDIDFDEKPAYRRKPFQNPDHLAEAIAQQQLEDAHPTGPDAETVRVRADLDEANAHIHTLQQQLVEAAGQRAIAADTITRLRTDLAAAPAESNLFPNPNLVTENETLRTRVKALEQNNDRLRAKLDTLDGADRVEPAVEHGIHIHLNLTDIIGHALGQVAGA